MLKLHVTWGKFMTPSNVENYQFSDNLLSPYLGVIVIIYLQNMIEPQNELDMYPMVKNRNIVNLYPTKIYLDWLNYIRDSEVCLGLNDIEPVSFLINNFDDKSEFNSWLQTNFQLIFEIRLTYSCIEKSLWPEERTFNVFKKWFNVSFSDMIIDLKSGPIEMM